MVSLSANCLDGFSVTSCSSNCSITALAVYCSTVPVGYASRNCSGTALVTGLLSRLNPSSLVRQAQLLFRPWTDPVQTAGWGYYKSPPLGMNSSSNSACLSTYLVSADSVQFTSSVSIAAPTSKQFLGLWTHTLCSLAWPNSEYLELNLFRMHGSHLDPNQSPITYDRHQLFSDLY
ncbi:hypothetical protein F2Q70_00015914 [Brassica cretica]|uniref:Uncharacterized protein n=1 Tax=Brassica cretica TaxID=69181 RepID=A0A8S9HQZ8_BRACR|nr:hypothetical protein F2Q70_00015914 [Brassica cretica]